MKTVQILILTLILFMYSCAIIVQPSGGPKDYDPPEIVKVTPPDKSIYFKSPWKIEYEFNEFIVLNNLRNELIISPPLDEFPKYTVNGKKLILSSNEELKENTTYVFQFANAIKDYTEGNILTDYTYVFSTGSYIDSQSIQGEVFSLVKHKKAQKRIVILHPWGCDTCIYKNKPLYFSRIDSMKYRIENLPRDTFELFVLGDKNGNYSYDPGEEIGFFKDCIVTDTSRQMPRINLFIEAAKTRIMDYGSLFPFAYFVKTESPDSIKLFEGKTGKELIQKRKQNDSIYFWTKEKYCLVTRNDKILDTLFLEESKKKVPALKLEMDFDRTLFRKLKIIFNQPITETIKDSIQILFDSTQYLNYDIRWTDSSKTCLELETDFKAGKKYFLMVQDSAFMSMYGKYNAKVLKELFPFSEQMLGIIEIVPESANKEAVFFELYSAKGELIRKEFWEGREKVEFNQLIPGNYSLRAIIDNNRNGIWDSGVLQIRKLAEPVIYYPEEIVLKANWELRDLIFRLE